MKKDKMVLVDWVDSNVLHGWAFDTEEGDIAHCRTVGILKAEDETKITIALSDSDCETSLERITIPKNCITKIRELRVK